MIGFGAASFVPIFPGTELSSLYHEQIPFYCKPFWVNNKIIPEF
jgi:hypothetical protein